LQEELDRQTQLVQSLTTQNADLTASIETIRTELLSSHSEASQLSQDLSALRSKSLYESNQDTHQLQSMQLELERIRLERDESEQMYLREKVVGDERRADIERLVGEVAGLEGETDRLTREVGEEKEKVGNLQEVLEDFQNGECFYFIIARRGFDDAT
jgi:predicted  nucleic acid-binding Zn-ribbon protein